VTAAAAPNLFQQQEANRRRTTWLVIGFVLFFAWLGFGGDFILARYTAETAGPGDYRHTGPWIGLVVTAIAAIMAAYAYRTGPEKVMWATGAREIDMARTDPERQLVNVVEEMAIAAGLPRPRIWLVPDPDPNAFATGRDPQHSHIAVTEGLLAKLNRDELQGVVAHELGHIKNFDVRLMTTLAALVGAVLLIQDGVWRAIRHGPRIGGSRGGGGGGGKKNDAGPLIIALLVLWLVSWMLAPAITQILALGVSRKREYLADAMAAQFTRNPLALAAALEKIEQNHEPTKAIRRGAAHLCIADPLGRRLTNREGFLADALATHPPMAMRIARLKGMGYAQLKRESGQVG
jgi:heat shock protein HtpX